MHTSLSYQLIVSDVPAVEENINRVCRVSNTKRIRLQNKPKPKSKRLEVRNENPAALQKTYS
jgi:hypothetical protein